MVGLGLGVDPVDMGNFLGGSCLEVAMIFSSELEDQHTQKVVAVCRTLTLVYLLESKLGRLLCDYV